jgi:hypothetical protein
MEIGETIGDFFSEPFGTNSLYFYIDREIGLPLSFEELYIWLNECEFAVFIFWFSMNDNGISSLERSFEKRCVEENALCEHTIDI